MGMGEENNDYWKALVSGLKLVKDYNRLIKIWHDKGIL